MTHVRKPTKQNFSDCSAWGSPELAALWAALQARRFFKLISGGSFTELSKIASVVRAYALAGADCIDIASELAVVETVTNVLSALPGRRPVVMVSVPLDPDPHFRKIELDEPDCIRCGLCLPVCPTEALTLPDALAISQALCYGCGRCVPVCPTDALSLLPFQVESQLEAVLSHPMVQAVEIHSRYVDSYMLEAFLERWKPQLENKLISLCFRLEGISAEQALAFYETAERLIPLPVMLQIDGAPMSGNDDPEASRPALESAVSMMNLFAAAGWEPPPITISGGINAQTATWLQDPRYAFIAGVGMGTVARKKVWALEGAPAVGVATDLVESFQKLSQEKT